MLEAYVSFAGPTGQLLNYMGNSKAIEAPTITRTGVGRYTVIFLTGRLIDASKIASSNVTVQCQSPSGTGTVTNVIPSPVAVFNPNAKEWFWQVTIQIETQNVVPGLLVLGPILSFMDRSVVMVCIQAKNDFQGDDDEVQGYGDFQRYSGFQGDDAPRAVFPSIVGSPRHH